MAWRAWLHSTIGWDGCLPLVVAASPTLLRQVIPAGVLLQFTAILLAPIVAALIRAHHAHEQLKRRHDGRATYVRQFLLGCAILLLLAFEIFSGLLQLVLGGPPAGWLVNGAIYLAYLVLMTAALPPRRLRKEPIFRATLDID